MPAAPIEAVFFDIDDTLVDAAAATRAGALGVFERYRDRLTGTDERLMQRWNALLDHHFERYLRGETSFIGQRRARIRGLFGLTPSQMPDSEVDAVDTVYREFTKATRRLFPDAIETLDALGCCRLGVISNGVVCAAAPEAGVGRHPGSLRGRGDLGGHRGRETPSGNLRGGLRSCGYVAVGVPTRG